MAYSEQFAVDEGDFSLFDQASYEAGLGNPAGCIKLPHYDNPGGGPGEIHNNTIVNTVEVADVMKFYYRFIDSDDQFGENSCLTIRVETDFDSIQDDIDFPATDDTGWLVREIDISSIEGDDITNIEFTTADATGNSVGYVLVDYVYIGDTAGGPSEVSYVLTHSADGMPGAII